MKLLSKFYPGADIVNLKSQRRIDILLESKASCTWGHGLIPDTNYYQLARYAPSSPSGHIMIVVCHKKFIKDLNNE